MESFEKLGLFYLGKLFNPDTQQVTPEYLLYDARDLVTHAVCVGMTGSGKTGLCIGLLEEAAIDQIPAIVIDPKGDLGNLLLNFPNLDPADLIKWVKPDEAERHGLTVEQFAAKQAELWRQGLGDWGQTPERIARLGQSAEFAIYTPGSMSGVPVSLLKSFSPPSTQVLADPDLLRERILTTTSSLLGLVRIDADPLRSREHILISNILEQAWLTGRTLDLPQLIQLIQAPPLSRIGVFDLDSFYPASARVELAMLLNNLLASPGFEAWMEGEPLEVDRFLYTESGKPRVSIFSIAHLSDPERMFFVTLLLNQVLGWMRTQPGTTSLRALLYMDEVFGFLPPVASPPSKRVFLTLLKQARAFGLGLVLATQNPVDLDYKGLSNTGTWFIGRLQTERDKDRLLEGLTSATAGTGSSLDSSRISDLLSRLGKRVFLMHNVHARGPELFQTRWTLSYLAGPLTRDQIKELTKSRDVPERQPGSTPAIVPPLPQSALAVSSAPAVGVPSGPPFVPEVNQFFLPADSGTGIYTPFFFAAARISLLDNRYGVAYSEDVAHVYPIVQKAVSAFLWDDAQSLPPGSEERFSQVPPPGGSFASLPAGCAHNLKAANLGRTYRDFLARIYSVRLWRSQIFKVVSQPNESERDFRIRLAQLSRERRDFELDRLRQRYASQFETLSRQEESARLEIRRQEHQYGEQKLQTAISVGAGLLGALFSRSGLGTIGRATTAARGATRISRERQDIERANAKLQQVQQRRAALEERLRQEADRLAASFDPHMETLQEIQIRPKKADILVKAAGLLWIQKA
ncbi:MAG TPA: ATP-binding protein [Acidobacteriota bacterium]|nr:ATP-binding protein [Acidobacteriota bacterium]